MMGEREIGGFDEARDEVPDEVRNREPRAGINQTSNDRPQAHASRDQKWATRCLCHVVLELDGKKFLLLQSADFEDGEADDVSLVVDFLHDCIILRLTRTSHQLSAPAADMALPASLRSFGLLGVSQRIRLREPRSQALQPKASRRIRFESR